MVSEIVKAASKSVLAVGKGRGFVLDTKSDTEPPAIVTAAHCLPHLPDAHPNSYTEERTYMTLLGRLDEQGQPVTAECLFVDPVADIAVLGAPDGQSRYEEHDAYYDLINTLSGLHVSDPPEQSSGWLLGLDGQWFSCTIENFDGSLAISDASAAIDGGMSGSPILADDGTAIGTVCSSDGGGASSFGQPCLTYNLPGWLLRQIGTKL